MSSLDEVAELNLLLGDRETDTRVKAGIVDDVFKDADPLIRNFLKLLVEKGRAGQIRDVAAEFELLVAAGDHVLDVELTTAQELSDKAFAQIVAEIEKKSGRKVQATRSVDADLIGGIVLEAGSMRLDASIRGQLDRLRHELVHT